MWDGFVTCVALICYVFEMVLVRAWHGFVTYVDGFITRMGWFCYVCGIVLLRV